MRKRGVWTGPGLCHEIADQVEPWPETLPERDSLESAQQFAKHLHTCPSYRDWGEEQGLARALTWVTWIEPGAKLYAGLLKHFTPLMAEAFL